MAQHNTLTDPELHEPKGISVAPSGAVYIADGVGGGVWTVPSSHSVPYGGMNIVDNHSTVIAVSAASDAFLDNDSDYIQVDAGLWVTNITSGVTFNTNRLEINEDGIYFATAWGSFAVAGGSANKNLAFKFSTDGTNGSLSPTKVFNTLDFGGDTQTVSSSGVVSLSAGDSMSLFVAAAQNVNLTMKEAGMSLHRIV